MAKQSPASKIVLKAFDDLFENDESRAENKREKLLDIPIEKITDFPEHPYQVKDDENMVELVESIKSYGLLQPVLVRSIDDGMYEMISGHRRKRAFEIAGITEIPARVMELTKDEATLMMVDSNLQRDEILPSEKAFAYKMKLEALNRQGQRTDLTSNPVGGKLKESASIVGEQSGDSATQVRRYIRLTELIPELLTLVDEKRIALRPAVEISYLPKETQQWLAEAIEYTEATPSHAQTIQMRKSHDEGKLTHEVLDFIMEQEKPNQKEKPLSKDTKRIVGLIPQSVPSEKQGDYVCKALEFYNRYLERKREQSR